ncbi:MAG: Rnase Y domain-containing protein, partial [Chloroflexota bacterium]|nr:Rnase Y domain-containing protein [Chloroflexota bacterium]
MTDLLVPLSLLLGVLAGSAGAYFYLRSRSDGNLQEIEARTSLLNEEAATKQKQLVLDAQAEALRIRSEAEAEVREQRTNLSRSERRLQQKDENLDRKLDALDGREQRVQSRERDIEKLRTEAE